MSEVTLLSEKLVWMMDSDFTKLIDAANINSILLSYGPEGVTDLDGDPVDEAQIKRWEQANNEAHEAAARAKYVPDTQTRLKLIVMSD